MTRGPAWHQGEQFSNHGDCQSKLCKQWIGLQGSAENSWDCFAKDSSEQHPAVDNGGWCQSAMGSDHLGQTGDKTDTNLC